MAQQTEDVCLEHKVVLIGDHMVGKTSLFTRFKTGRFVQVPSQTRKEAEHMKKWTQNGEELCITLYDTAGMERYEATVPPTYFRNAKAVILVYAINNTESIDNIIHWAESMSFQRLGNTSQSLVRALVANKLDLDDLEPRQVQKSRGKNTAEACEISEDMFFEVSAKTGEGVDEMFAAIARRIKGPGEQEKRGTATLSSTRAEKPRCCG